MKIPQLIISDIDLWFHFAIIINNNKRTSFHEPKSKTHGLVRCPAINTRNNQEQSRRRRRCWRRRWLRWRHRIRSGISTVKIDTSIQQYIFWWIASIPKIYRRPRGPMTENLSNVIVTWADEFKGDDVDYPVNSASPTNNAAEPKSSYPRLPWLGKGYFFCALWVASRKCSTYCWWLNVRVMPG